jgi:hypothetical protein
MRDVIAWVQTHRWETVSGVLGVLLVSSLAVLAVNLDDTPEQLVVDITTTTLAPETTVAPQTTISGDDPVTTTSIAPVEGSSGVVAVVVDNVADVGLQVGIGEADLLIEIPVEGGITRFTAIYGQQIPELIGPVRSLRPVSADILALFRPVVFTTGGQRFVTGAVSATGTSIVTTEMSVAFQSLERPQPYHVFVSPLAEVAAGVEVEMPWAGGEWVGGEPLAEMTLPISEGITWRFEDGTYLRYRDGQPHQVLTAIDGEPQPLSRDTLIVLVANRKSAGYTDSAGFDVPTFDVVGGGDLYVLHAGEMVEGTWFRASQAAGYVFAGPDGEPVPIPDGRVYWAIVPAGESVHLGG